MVQNRINSVQQALKETGWFFVFLAKEYAKLNAQKIQNLLFSLIVDRGGRGFIQGG